MDVNNFKKLLENFSIYTPTYEKTEIMFELVTGELVTIKFNLDDDGTVKSIVENGNEISLHIFISERLGRLSSLSKSISTSLKSTECFVSPGGIYDLNWTRSDILENGTESVDTIIDKIIKTPNQYETHVIYLTSNAGEGKTTIIEKIANDYSLAYKPDIKSKLIVPISLSGKPFIRFDDLIIGTIVNQFKFIGFFYNSFIELVKLGYIIPAFDGFEEMFIESQSGEAINTMGDFIKELNGQGTILVAARSAYYEYQNLSTQSKIYDSLSNLSVVFSKINIQKWTQTNFIEYGEARGYTKMESTSLYNNLLSNFGKDHPVLTRAILIKKIYDIFEESDDISIFNNMASSDYNEFYKNFIDALLYREANKWLTKKEIAKQVLSVVQHKKLLGMIAREMWTAKSEILRHDLIDMITDLFIEDEKLDVDSAWQVKSRIKDHALLKISDINKQYNKQYIEFDHQDFYQFFLGETIFTSLVNKNYTDIFDIARRGRLPQITITSCAYNFKNKDNYLDDSELIARMNLEQKVSYTKENVSLLLLSAKQDDASYKLNGISFDSEPFNKINLNNIIFNDCIFSSLILSKVVGHLEFINCKILEIKMDKEEYKDILLDEHTEINSLHKIDDDVIEYSPVLIRNILEKKLSCKYKTTKVINNTENNKEISDEELIILGKTLRIFFNRIAVNSDVINIRLGVKQNIFWNDIYPHICDRIFEEIPFTGGGNQKRLRIICPMEKIQAVLETSKGDFKEFIKQIDNMGTKIKKNK
jgi:hypothetical protein